MMTLVSYVVFAAALGTSLAVFFYTLAPAMPRIVALLSGREQVTAAPQLVLRDRPAPSRAWPVQPVPRSERRAAA